VAERISNADLDRRLSRIEDRHDALDKRFSRLEDQLRFISRTLITSAIGFVFTVLGGLVVYLITRT
jgi:hypothetical protein